MRIKLDERAVLMRDGLPLRALGPGRHLVWGSRTTELRWQTRNLVFESAPEVRAVLPAAWWTEVAIGPRERGILYRDGQARLFLRPGTHRYWTVDPTVRLEVLSVDAPLPELTAELAAILPAAEHVLVTVREHERGLKYVQGRLTEVLPPGRWAFWTHPGAEVDVTKVDMRSVQVALLGQELMTRDKVTLRLSLTAEWSIEDPALATHSATSVRDAIYLIVQLAARQFVAGVTLDELLEGRDAMTRWLEEESAPKARAIGARLERVGVKDVVLPGDMKTLLNRVIEAEKEAAANVILRREETAAMRSLANTARVMAEQPVLLRLKELDALKDIAEKIQEVRIVVGADGLANLLPAGLLAEKKS
jgi:regulator of protease activity HflC (stomatin/prohibitin superfamily)